MQISPNVRVKIFGIRTLKKTLIIPWVVMIRKRGIADDKTVTEQCLRKHTFSSIKILMHSFEILLEEWICELKAI